MEVDYEEVCSSPEGLCLILEELREEQLMEVNKAAASGSLRDLSPFPRILYKGLWSALQRVWRWRSKKQAQDAQQNKKRLLVFDIFKTFVHYPMIRPVDPSPW